jgi:HSP20 family protein
MATTTNEKTQIQPPQQPERVEQARSYTPAVDIYETDSAFILKAALPGMKAQNLDIQFDKGVLKLNGKVEPRGPAPSAYLWREYGIGNFSREFNIDVPVNAAEIRATLARGELNLYVPKTEAARTRQIPVRTA